MPGRGMRVGKAHLPVYLLVLGVGTTLWVASCGGAVEEGLWDASQAGSSGAADAAAGSGGSSGGFTSGGAGGVGANGGQDSSCPEEQRECGERCGELPSSLACGPRYCRPCYGQPPPPHAVWACTGAVDDCRPICEPSYTLVWYLRCEPDADAGAAGAAGAAGGGDANSTASCPEYQKDCGELCLKLEAADRCGPGECPDCPEPPENGVMTCVQVPGYCYPRCKAGYREVYDPVCEPTQDGGL